MPGVGTERHAPTLDIFRPRPDLHNYPICTTIRFVQLSDLYNYPISHVGVGVNITDPGWVCYHFPSHPIGSYLQYDGWTT